MLSSFILTILTSVRREAKASLKTWKEQVEKNMNNFIYWNNKKVQLEAVKR